MEKNNQSTNVNDIIIDFSTIQKPSIKPPSIKSPSNKSLLIKTLLNETLSTKPLITSPLSKTSILQEDLSLELNNKNLTNAVIHYLKQFNNDIIAINKEIEKITNNFIYIKYLIDKIEKTNITITDEQYMIFQTYINIYEKLMDNKFKTAKDEIDKEIAKINKKLIDDNFKMDINVFINEVADISNNTLVSSDIDNITDTEVEETSTIVDTNMIDMEKIKTMITTSYRNYKKFSNERDIINCYSIQYYSTKIYNNEMKKKLDNYYNKNGSYDNNILKLAALYKKKYEIYSH
jgi:hypothetical protein